MSQHFLLSAAARTLSVAKVARMSDEEARGVFRKIRWAETDGEAVCPHCGCCACYEFKSRPIWKCKGCLKQFSLTSGTLFACRKLPIRDYLLAIAIFVSRLRRAEIGQHHRVGVHLAAYAGEMAWRENNRRQPNGTLFQLVAASAAASAPSRQWKGYWQGAR